MYKKINKICTRSLFHSTVKNRKLSAGKQRLRYEGDVRKWFPGRELHVILDYNGKAAKKKKLTSGRASPVFE
jgi:hypothetical protein